MILYISSVILNFILLKFFAIKINFKQSWNNLFLRIIISIFSFITTFIILICSICYFIDKLEEKNIKPPKWL